MKKRILAAVVAAAAVMSLAGCGDKNTSSNAGTSKPAANNSNDASTPADNSTDASAPAVELTDEDNTLTIGTWADNGDMVNLINTFKEVTGTNVEVTTVNGGGSGGEARDGYLNLLADDSVDVDLIICDAGWTRNYVSTDEYCVPVSDLGITKDEYKDAYAYTLGVGTGDDGVLRGVTFQATPGCFFYNTKLAEEYLGVKTTDEMQAKVKDWATFNATAKELTEKSGGKCALQCTMGGLWQVYQVNRTKPWVVNGQVQMDTAPDFLDIAKDLYDNKGVTDAPQWDSAWYATMQAGDALGEFAPTWGLTGLTGSILGDCAGEDRRDDNAVYAAVEGPQSWYWGGSYLCVTKKCNTKKTAAEFLRFYTLNAQNGMAEYNKKTGDFMNNKTVMASATYKNPSLVGGQDHLKVIAAGAEKIDMDGKLTIYDSKINDAFNAVVVDYAKGKIDKDTAIKTFKDKVLSDYPSLSFAD